MRHFALFTAELFTVFRLEKEFYFSHNYALGMRNFLYACDRL